jgi:transcriptional regulator with XRE-family HTH domain
MKTIIGKNLKMFREASNFTAQQFADLLSIERSTYANYEAGIREMPFELLEKTADFLGCDLSALLSEDASKADLMLCAFRMDNLTSEDAEQISKFKKFVKSYLKMQKLLQDEQTKHSTSRKVSSKISC